MVMRRRTGAAVRALVVGLCGACGPPPDAAPGAAGVAPGGAALPDPDGQEPLTPLPGAEAAPIAPAGNLTVALIPIAAGPGRIGSPAGEGGRAEDEHEVDVVLTRSVLIGRTEITQGDYLSLMGWNPSFFSPSDGRPAHLDPAPAAHDPGPQQSTSTGEEPAARPDRGRGEPGWPDPAVGAAEDARLRAAECVDVDQLTPRACGLDCPVENVSWFDALAFANAASVVDGLPPCFAFSEVVCADGAAAADPQLCQTPARGGVQDAVVTTVDVQSPLDCFGYRLPTEAEWELAARAGAATPFPPLVGDGVPERLGCGEDDPEVSQWAWYAATAGGQPHPVAGKLANSLGLHDMHGNVWEWTLDGGPSRPGRERGGLWPEGDAEASPGVWKDPLPWAGFPKRISKGGCWLNPAFSVRAASRDELPPASRNAGLGLRLARTAL